MITEAKIGTTVPGMVYVESLVSSAMRPPAMDYKPAARYETLASGHVRLIGLPVAKWEFLELTPSMVDALRAYCPGGSAHVYIRTRTNRNNDEYKIFSAIMRWPEDESIAHFLNRRQTLTIEFRDLVEQP